MNAPVSLGVKANSLSLLGNISQKLDRTLRINPAGGKIIDDKEAIMMSSRQYEPGWEPKV